MKINAFIKKDFQGDFRIFSKDGKYYAQWDFVPSEDIEGWGNITEDSVHPCGDYAKDVAAIIDLRYSLDAEIALNRQCESKPQEWQEYYDFCEEAKRVARGIVENEQLNQ